jgi:diaminopimelate epimerase
MTTLTKHHGLGNDFLVLEREWGTQVTEADVPFVVALCDRRRGIGADGLLFLSIDPESPDRLSMVLLNADGSRAEMSGNGIRCLVQAAFMSQQRTDACAYTVETDAGERYVVVRPGPIEDVIDAEVDMGAVGGLPEPAGWSALQCDPLRPVRHLTLGNPHSVVGVEDVSAVDLEQLGSIVPHVNLEIVEPGPEPLAITMRVHERGAGITEACGTGACASAWAAAQWGLVPASATEIVVHMDGGDASVRLNTPHDGHVTLVGPATFVATLTI